MNEELLHTIMSADHAELSEALAVRMKEGQRRFEEYHKLQCLLTEDTMTREKYVLADLLAFLKRRRDEGLPCGLCIEIWPSATEAECGAMTDDGLCHCPSIAGPHIRRKWCPKPSAPEGGAP